MQINPHQEPNHNINNFINNILTDLKNLTNSLRPISKPSAQANNALINKLLLGNDRDSLQLAKDILSHLLHIVDMKGINTSILTILAKVIAFIKILQETQSKGQNRVFEVQLYSQFMNTILYHIIDIIFLLKNKHKDVDMALRIIQTAFSLIDSKILQFANENLFIRIYSICFQCCLSSPIIQNISISALFALTEIIFSSGNNESSLSILNHFLEFVFNSKRFTWLKQMQFKGIVWDLIIVAIRNFPLNQMVSLRDNKSVFVLLNIMYKTSIQKVFVNTEETKSPKGKDKSKKNENQKSINFKKGSFTDFIRYYKSFIYLSIHLSIRCYNICGQIIPFRQSLHLFKIANELERGTKLYILLEGISLLITEGHSILIQDDKGIIILDVVCKIIEQICLSAVVIDLSVEVKDFYLQKMCGDFSKISDSDHARLIRNLIIKLRKKFQNSEQQKAGQGQLQSARSQLSQRSQIDANSPKPLSEKKKWQRLVRTIISIIRYLTSLNMNEILNEQVVRKLIIQFQHWFLISPSYKMKNLILQELYNTSTLMDNKLQSIKVSQCVQLGSNIIYGYYDTLDSLGLTLIIRMMAGVKVSWEEGKGFEELDQVCSMSEKLFSEQRLVHNQKSFIKTIQALVQSANSILADFEVPQKNEQRGKKIGKNPQDKSIKLIDYIFSKMKIILEQNLPFIAEQWNFLTGFWISFCSHKIPQIRLKSMNHIGSINPILLKSAQIDQQLILSIYIQLSKLHIQQIPKLIIQQLKQFLSNISNEEAILQIFQIIRLLTESKQNKILFEEVYQLQEMIVKESIFKIKSVEKLMSIIDSITVLNSDKNQQYKIVNLIWSIFDHVKVISTNKEVKESEVLWKKIFNKIYLIGFHSVYGETKQSCIHVFTQVLAQSSHIIHQELFTTILQQNYVPLFIVLIGINQKAARVQNIIQAQSMKVAIKNLTKIIKKCLSQKNVAFTSLLEVINNKLLNFFKSDCQPSIQFLFELCSYFQLLKSLRQSETSLSQIDIGKISDILKMIQSKHGPLDKTSVFWRKKYEPVFTPLQTYFSKN